MQLKDRHIHLPLFDEKLIYLWISFLNERNFDEGSLYLADNVELFGTYVLNIIPDSNGLIKGKASVLSFLKIFFRQFSERKYQIVQINLVRQKLIVQLKDELNRTHFFAFLTNHENKISRFEICETINCT